MNNIIKQKNKSGDLVLIKCPDQKTIKHIRDSIFSLISILQNNTPASSEIKKELNTIEIDFISTAGIDGEPLILNIKDMKELSTITEGIIMQDKKENIELNQEEQLGQEAINYIHGFLKWVVI